MSGVGAGETPLGMSPRRWAVAGGVALVGVAAAATAVAGGFSGAPGGPPGGTSQPSASPSATALPTQSTPAEPTTEPTASAPPEPTPKPSRSSRPTATPAPTTYVVQEGDTLNGIAAAFGTTVEAIRQANGLAGDVINIGQVLIIP